MNWLARLSRNLGLMVHNIKQPPGSDQASERKEIKRTVEEQQIDSTTTLRRTTIEEVEIRNHPKTNDPKANDNPRSAK